MQKLIIANLNEAEILEIASKIKGGQIIVMPSDTIYGIFTSALKKESVERIYDLRKRNRSKALITLISDISELNEFNINLSDDQKNFLETIWPGAVSVILECSDPKFNYLHRGLNCLAFRIPDNKPLINFLKLSGPLVAPSANIEGEKPSETIEEAEKYFGNKIDYYLDGGSISGEASTVIKLNKDNSIEVIREGKVKF